MQKIDRWKLHEITRVWQKKAPLKVALMNWICSSKAQFNWFVTLTYKDEISRREDVETHCRHFMNRYNAAMGYKRHRRKSKTDKACKAPMICIIEGDGKYKRFHVHLFLYDEGKTLAELKRHVRWSWHYATDKHGSMLFSDFRPIHDFVGLANYLTKEVTSNSTHALALDATNIY